VIWRNTTLAVFINVFRTSLLILIEQIGAL
jgi:hypothetical protein